MFAHALLGLLWIGWKFRHEDLEGHTFRVLYLELKSLQPSGQSCQHHPLIEGKPFMEFSCKADFCMFHRHHYPVCAPVLNPKWRKLPSLPEPLFEDTPWLGMPAAMGIVTAYFYADAIWTVLLLKGSNHNSHFLASLPDHVQRSKQNLTAAKMWLRWYSCDNKAVIKADGCQNRTGTVWLMMWWYGCTRMKDGSDNSFLCEHMVR